MSTIILNDAMFRGYDVAYSSLVNDKNFRRGDVCLRQALGDAVNLSVAKATVKGSFGDVQTFATVFVNVPPRCQCTLSDRTAEARYVGNNVANEQWLLRDL